MSDACRLFTRFSWLSLLLTLALCGCAQKTSAPFEAETGERADVTAEGLQRVRGSRFDQAWVKPDADFAAYDAVLQDPVEVSYKRKPRSTHTDSTDSNFALSAAQMRDFERQFREVFEKELAASEHYRVVAEAGPSVLRLRPVILDLVVKVPTEERGSERSYTTSTARMTLLLELRDSLSGEILARIADRREARAPGASGINDLYYSNPVTNAAALRQLFAHWSRILRERLDSAHDLEPSRPLDEDS